MKPEAIFKPQLSIDEKQVSTFPCINKATPPFG